MSDEILTYIKDTVTRIETKQDKHEERISDVENWQSNANGKMTVLAAVGVAIGGAFASLINYMKHTP